MHQPKARHPLSSFATGELAKLCDKFWPLFVAIETFWKSRRPSGPISVCVRNVHRQPASAKPALSRVLPTNAAIAFNTSGKITALTVSARWLSSKRNITFQHSGHIGQRECVRSGTLTPRVV